MTPQEFYNSMLNVAYRWEIGMPEIMHKVGKIVQEEAKHMIGRYQTGLAPLKDWPKLSPDTLADKEAQGYSPPDNPLLRTGEMRDSIEFEASGFEAIIGSKDIVALFQELGTVNIPPRSFLGGALVRKADEIAGIIWGGSLAILEAGKIAKMFSNTKPPQTLGVHGGKATWSPHDTGEGW